ncbi:MAG: WD40 repeat domain-containing protein [bacterium]|nr:WD40 repeat domain-containing protein [bacterium]
MRRLILIIFVFSFVFASHAQETDIPPRPIITPENAHELTQIAQLGRGRILDIAFSEDENTLLVASTIGIWEYDMADLSAEPSLFAQRKLLNGSFSPDGELFISVADNVLTVWHITENRVIAQMTVVSKRQALYALSPDSRHIAVFLDKAIHILDIELNRINTRIPLPDRFDRIIHLKWSPDGTKIAIQNQVPDENRQFLYDEEFWMWDIATRQIVTYIAFPDFDDRSPHIEDIQFSPDGRLLLIGTPDEMRLWSVMGRVEQQVISERFVNSNRVLFSPNGRIIASAGGQGGFNYYDYDTTIHLWDVARGETVALMSGHLVSVTKMIFSSDGHHLASLDSKGVIRLWDTYAGEQIGVIRDHNNQGLLYGNSDDTVFVSGSSDNSLYVWDADTFTSQLIPDLSESPSPIEPIGFSPDGGTFIALNSFYEELLVMDTTTWQVRHIVPAFEFREAKFHDTLPIIGFRSRMSYVNFWNYETATPAFGNFEGQMMYYEFLSKTHRIIYNGTEWRDTPQVRAVASPLLVVLNTDNLQTIDILPSIIDVIAISPDEHMLITRRFIDESWVWDTTTWGIRYTLDGYYLAFTPDSRYIIMDIDNRMIFVDSETGIVEHEISIPSDVTYAYQLKFSPNRDWFAYVNEDAEFVLMDTQTGTVRLSFSVADLIWEQWGNDILPYVQISSDGQLIFIIGETTQVWAIGTGDMP